MNKKLSLFALSIFLLIVNAINAQNDSIAPYDEVYVFDTTSFENDTCLKPIFINSSAAYFGTKAWFHLEVDTPTPNNFPFSYSLYESGVQVGSSTTATNGHVVFNNLDINKVYTVKVTNTCGVSEDLSLIDANYPVDSGYVSASNKMMNALTIWVEDSIEKTKDIYTYVSGLPNIHLIEKISFLQRWKLKDVLPASYTGSMPPPSAFNLDLPDPIPGTDASTCTCQFVLRVDPDVSIGKKTQRVRTPDAKEGDIDAIPWAYEGGWGSTGYLKKGETREGAGKYQQLMGQRFERGEYSDEWITGDLSQTQGMGSSYGAWVRLHYVCTTVSGNVPNDCACERPVSISYRYDANAKAESKVNTCFLCDKNSFSEVEDLAIVAVNNERDNDFYTLDAGRTMVTSKSDISYNEQFGQDVAMITARTAYIVYQIQSGNVSPTLFTDIENVLTTAYTLPSFTKGSSQNSTFSNSLLFNTKTITIEPNHPHNIYMFSHSRLKIGGKRAFWSNSRLETSYYLSVRLDGGTSAIPDQEHCCSPVVGAYIIGSNPGTPLTLTSSQNSILSHFNDWPDWQVPNNGQLYSIDYDYGVKVGIVNQTCSTQVAFRVAPGEEEHFEQSIAKGIVSQNAIFIQTDSDNLNPKMCNYELYNFNGVLIKKGTITGTQKIWDIVDNNNLFYILKLEINGNVNTQKIAVIK